MSLTIPPQYALSGFSQTQIASSSLYALPKQEMKAHDLTNRMQSFIRDIQKASGTQTLDALTRVLHLVEANKLTAADSAFYKPSSYAARFFSGESWSEWSDNRSYLGRVVSACANFVTGESVKQLDSQILELANREAAALLEQKSDVNLADTISMVIEGTMPGEEIGRVINFVKNLSDNQLPALLLGSSGSGYVVFVQNASTVAVNHLTGTNGFTLEKKEHIPGFYNQFSSGHNVMGSDEPTLIFGVSVSKSCVYAVPVDKLPMPAIIPLNNFTAGFGLCDDTLYSTRGIAVAACDMNYDGVDDIVIGSVGKGKASLGFVRVIYGKKNGDIDPNDGFIIYGADPSDYFGASVACLKDFHGKGTTALAIGAIGFNQNAGRVYVVYSKIAPFSSFTISSLKPNEGLVVISDKTYDGIGANVLLMEDMNNDGLKELGIGSEINNRVDVVFGSTVFEGNFTVSSSINGTNGVSFFGPPPAVYGSTAFPCGIASGDVNNDNITDVAIGACFAEPDLSGKTYVVYGPNGPWPKSVHMKNITATTGRIYTGANPLDKSGAAVLIADVNGDGKKEIVIGAPGANSKAGRVYVVYETTTGINKAAIAAGTIAAVSVGIALYSLYRIKEIPAEGENSPLFTMEEV